MPLPGVSNQNIPSGVVNINDPLQVTGIAGLPVEMVLSDSANIDAFSRLRVSNPGGRADATFAYDKNPLVFDELVGGAGSLTHDGNLRAVYLNTGGNANADEATLLLHYYAPYTPGNSQLVIISGNLNPDNEADWTNARSEIGYGDTLNGVGFRYDATGASIFLRSSISGAPSDLVNVPQAAWNVATVPGVDWATSQIFIIDFQSLAVGRIRFYLDRSGETILVHEIINDNVRIGPYWQIATLPPYWKVENTGIATVNHRVLAICVTVKSEGSVDLEKIAGLPFSASNIATPKTVSTTLIPVLSIQLKTTFGGYPNRGLVRVEDVAIMGTNPANWALILNPTLTGPAFASVHADSLVNVDTTATVLAGGIKIVQGFIGGGQGGARGSLATPITGKIPLHVQSDLAQADILTLAAIRVGAQDSALSAALNWQEIR